MALRTPLCDLLGIDVPILNVGFGASATPELVAAVSNAGGLGVLGCGIPIDAVRERVARTRALTSRPFGGNIIIAIFTSPESTEERRELRRRHIAAVFELKVPVVVLFWGDPTPFVRAAHESGVKLLVQVGSVEEATRAAAAGVDAVIFQGVEAGGHVRATRSLWEQLPSAVRACGRTPVIASGGIGDGAGIARALRMGAQGVSLGTRFVACTEAWIPDDYKRRVVNANAADTVLTPDLYDIGFRGAPHRSLRNATFATWDAAGRPEPGHRPGEGEVIGRLRLPWADTELHRYESTMLVPTFEGALDAAPMWAGESVDQVHDIKPAGEIVRQLAAEAEAALAG